MQLRVVRAFKSTLEDMEERRSVHSLQALRTSRSHPGPRPLSDISYIDEEAREPSLSGVPLATVNAQTNTAPGVRHPALPAGCAALRHQHSLNATAMSGSGPGLNETAPLLAKEPQMERSRSAPFASMHPIATNLQYNQTSGSLLAN